MSSSGQRSRFEQRNRTGYWRYMVPGLVSFVVILFVPFIGNIYLSLHDWRGGHSTMKWVGLENYQALMHDDKFWTSFSNSIYMIGAMVVIPTLLGLIIAAALFDYIGKKFSGRVASFLRASYYIPQILPIAVAGILWNWILSAQGGALNTILTSVGIDNPPNWLGDPDFALYAVMLVLIWAQIGYPVVIFMSALQRVDPELYEAAELDGATWWKRFVHITLPQIKPETFVVVLTCTVAALKVFAPIYVLTKGGPESSTLVPSYYSYITFFTKSEIGYGAAIASVLALVIVIVAAVILALQNLSERREREGTRA